VILQLPLRIEGEVVSPKIMKVIAIHCICIVQGRLRSSTYFGDLRIICLYTGTRVSVVGCGTMLQAGRSRVLKSDEVIGFLNLPNPCSRTMALGSTQPLTEMSTRNLPGGKAWPACKAGNLYSNSCYRMMRHGRRMI
jgi:hypothetical protein